jgi:hypothetical protein
MDDQRSDSDNLMSFIATTVEALRDQVTEMHGQVVTKSDLETQITLVRGDIERVDLHLGNIERVLSTRLDQIETELSRVRSVVYLLVKDKPEMLRLLGG